MRWIARDRCGWMGVRDKRRCLRRGAVRCGAGASGGASGTEGGFRISPLRSLWTPITPLKRFLAGASCPLPEGPPLGMAPLRMRDMVLRKHSSRLRRRMRLQTNILRQQEYSSALRAKNTALNEHIAPTKVFERLPREEYDFKRPRSGGGRSRRSGSGHSPVRIDACARPASCAFPCSKRACACEGFWA